MVMCNFSSSIGMLGEFSCSFRGGVCWIMGWEFGIGILIGLLGGLSRRLGPLFDFRMSIDSMMTR